MTPAHAMDLIPLLGSGTQDVESLAATVATVSPDTSCDEVNQLFRRDPALSAVLVRDRSRTGLVSKGSFQAALVGRLGFGGALYGARPVSKLADWSPLVLPAGTSTHEAAATVLGGRRDGQLPDVIIVGAYGVLTVVTAASILQALSGNLAQQSLHDSLTGLPNRDFFLGCLDRATSSDAGGSVAVLFLDIDGFKVVNDQLGHSAGDRLLQQVAGRMREAVRPGDLAARLAGDEFAVLLELPAGPGQQPLVLAVAQRLRNAIGAPLLVSGRQLHPRVSIGAAIAGSTADSETLMREADLAMYQSKRGGGHRVTLVDGVGDALHPGGLGAFGIDDTLPRALAAEQFHVHYQPIIDVATGAVVSAEALVRWAHPTAGLLGPGSFLPEAERTGFIVELGTWVLDEACRQLADWDRTLGGCAPKTINVNLAIRQLDHPDLVRTVERTLRRHGLAAGRLVLELPEGASFAQLADAAEPVRRLRERGVRFTLDDLGTGASSLSHLNALTIDGIKIDQTFVAGLLTETGDAAIVRLLIELARALGVPATAEGVETAEQLQSLVALGCTYVQGYYLGRPVEPAAVTWAISTGHGRRLGTGTGAAEEAAAATAPERPVAASRCESPNLPNRVDL